VRGLSSRWELVDGTVPQQNEAFGSQGRNLRSLCWCTVTALGRLSASPAVASSAQPYASSPKAERCRAAAPGWPDPVDPARITVFEREEDENDESQGSNRRLAGGVGAG
jgi:hypothetical protein